MTLKCLVPDFPDQSGLVSVAVTNGVVTYIALGLLPLWNCDPGYSPVNNSVNITCLIIGHWS